MKEDKKEYVATLENFRDVLSSHFLANDPWRAAFGYAHDQDCLEDELIGNWDLALKLAVEVVVHEVLWFPENLSDEETEQWMADFCPGNDAFDVDSPPEWITGEEVARYRATWVVENDEVKLTGLTSNTQPRHYEVRSRDGGGRWTVDFSHEDEGVAKSTFKLFSLEKSEREHRLLMVTTFEEILEDPFF